MDNFTPSDDGRQQEAGGQSIPSVEDIRWKNPPYGRATLLSDELNNLFNLIMHMNEPEYITIPESSFNGEISLQKKLEIMDHFISRALNPPYIEDIEWKRDLSSADTKHRRKLADELDYIEEKLLDINDATKILLDSKTINLQDKLRDIQMRLDDSYRGRSIESISYAQTPKGHKSFLSDELKYIHELINSADSKYKTIIQTLDQFASEIRALKERTNMIPSIHKFSIVNESYEVGSTVTAIEVEWETNKVMRNGYITIDGNQVADIKDYLGIDYVLSSGSILVPNLKIYDNKTVNIEFIDDLGISVFASSELKFKHKIIYGAVPYGTDIDQVVLDRLIKSSLLDNPCGKNLKIQSTDYGDFVPVVAIPKSFGIADYQLRINNGKWIHQVIDYTNHNGYKTPYDIYILDRTISGITVVSILDFI